MFPTKLSLPVDRPTPHKTLFLIKVLSLSLFFSPFFFFGGAILRRINVAIVHQDLYYIYKIPHRVSRSVLCTCVLSTEQYVHGLYDGIEVEKKVVIAAIQSATPSLLLPSANVVTSKDRGGMAIFFFFRLGGWSLPCRITLAVSVNFAHYTHTHEMRQMQSNGQLNYLVF